MTIECLRNFREKRSRIRESNRLINSTPAFLTWKLFDRVQRLFSEQPSVQNRLTDSTPSSHANYPKKATLNVELHDASCLDETGPFNTRYRCGQVSQGNKMLKLMQRVQTELSR